MISLNSHFIRRTVVPGEDGVPANHDDDRNEETAGTAQVLEDRSPARQDGRRSTPETVKRLRTGETETVTLAISCDQVLTLTVSFRTLSTRVAISSDRVPAGTRSTSSARVRSRSQSGLKVSSNS